MYMYMMYKKCQSSPNNYYVLKGYLICSLRILWLRHSKASKQKNEIAFEEVIIIWTNIIMISLDLDK